MKGLKVDKVLYVLAFIIVLASFAYGLYSSIDSDSFDTTFDIELLSPYIAYGITGGLICFIYATIIEKLTKIEENTRK